MAQPDNRKLQITSDELIVTIVRQPPTPPGVNLRIPPDTKLNFSIKN